MTATEYRTHFTLWAMLAAPLLAGNDLTKMTPETVSILTNKEVIAIDQDPLGQQGHRVWQEGPLEVWVKALADGGKAVALFNRGHSAGSITVRYADIGFKTVLSVRNLWTHEDVAPSDSFTSEIPRHGVAILRVK